MPGSPGFRQEVKQRAAFGGGAGLSRFLAVSFSKQYMKSWHMFPSAALAMRATIPAKGLERQLGRGSCIHLKQQQLALPECIWHH